MKIIGIDPDVERSGVAILDLPSRSLHLFSLSFAMLVGRLFWFKAQTENITIVIEAGWLNHSNWHITQYDSKGQACAKGYHVGRNHEVGIKLVEIARYLGYQTIEQRPLRKFWKGTNGKITQDELFQLTGYKGRTNQDARDAALLAWNYAKLPIKINKK